MLLKNGQEVVIRDEFVFVKYKVMKMYELVRNKLSRD